MLDVGIFGSRDPLPPRIASLAVELTVTPTTKVDQISSEDERNNEVKSLGSSGAASPGVSPSASTSSGIRNSNVVTPQEDIVTEPSATLSAVPIPGAYTHVKWSDLAAFGSQAFQQRATTKDPEVAMPYSIVATIIKYPDLLDALLLNCPDFPTLFALIASCKTVKRAFEQHSQGIIKAMLRPMPQELRYLTVALIGVNGSQIATSASIKMVMETWLGSGPKPLTKRLEVCTSSISSFISDPDQDFNMSHKTLEGIQGRVAPLMSSYDDSSCCHQSDNCGHFSSLRSFAAHTHVAQKHTDSENHQTNPIEIIRNLARSFGAIELFTEVIPKNCVENFADYKTVLSSREGLNHYEVTQWSNNHPLLQQTEWSDVPDDTEWFVDDLPDPEAGPHEIALPLSDGERYRIKRALLRYELFCAVFYLGPDRYYDTRHHPNRYMPVPDYSRRNAFREDQTIFLNDYVNPWEVGELAVVAHFMYDLVRYVRFGAEIQYKLHRYIGLPDKIRQQQRLSSSTVVQALSDRPDLCHDRILLI